MILAPLLRGKVSATASLALVLVVTVTLESTAKGKTRTVVLHLEPGARIVTFTRAAKPGKGFVEQTVALSDLKPGWIVSTEARHEADKEVAEVVKVVPER